MEQKIKVSYSFKCPWDQFVCESKEDAQVIMRLLKKRFPGSPVKMSDAVKNMVKIDRWDGSSSDLKEFLIQNEIEF